MRPKPLLFVAGVVILIVCLFMLSQSPVWPSLGYRDFMAMLGVGISTGMLITWIAARFTPRQGPRG